MKKILITIFALSLCLSGCGNKDNISNDDKQNSYNAERTISLDNIDNTNNNNINNTNADLNTDNNSDDTNKDDKENKNEKTELSSFSTKVYTPNDKGRQNNIQITCSKLNETVVKKGETFSFCDTVGKATPEKGYQKADIFDKDGNKIKGYGGGNCQISSTLYNAVLALPNLTVIERHEHSRKVYYVPEGKDAAVAYGSIDFKFRNDYDYDIKIYASADTNHIYTKIVKA